MRQLAFVAAGIAVLAIACRRAGDGTAATGAAMPFAVAAVHLERNATDGDLEVVFEVKGGDDGLTSLTIRGPDGRTVAAFTAPDTATMGMRQFRFESPEPTDGERMRAAYPEGAYAFAGVAAGGDRYAGTATLSHRLPPTATVLSPVDEAEDVAIAGLVITWTPAAEVMAYVVTVEQPELDFSLSVRLPGSAAAFVVPDGVLQPGREYQLAIGTMTTGGNASFVETSFATAGKE